MQTGSRTGGGHKDTPSSAAEGRRGIIQGGSAPPPSAWSAANGAAQTAWKHLWLAGVCVCSRLACAAWPSVSGA